MADFTALKTAIQTYIKQNGNEEITGERLQEILLSMVTTLGDSAINDLVTALANEVAARQNADGTLQQNITNEATARGNADTALGGRIDDEETARANGDTALSNRLGSSITAENTAADQIGAEAEARAAADTALQGLIDGITNNIKNGYVYAGIATPSSTPATGKVFYLALTAGTYTNLGNIEVSQGINILKYNGSAWSLDAFIGIDDELSPGSNNLPKSGNVLGNIIKNGSAFDLSAYNAVDGVLATYADLDAALTALNLLPAVYKQPGMSFRFVLTSDNKYVSCFLPKDEWSTNVDDWEKINLEKELEQLSEKTVSKKYDSSDAISGNYYNTPSNSVGSYLTYDIFQSTYWVMYPVFTLYKGQVIKIATFGGSNARAYCICDANDLKVIAIANSNEDLRENPYVYTADRKVFVYVNDTAQSGGYVLVNDNLRVRSISLENKVESLNKIIEPINNVESIISETNSMNGYVIDTNGSLIHTVSGYTVHFYEVQNSQILHISLKRSENSGSTRLSGAFYFTNDDENYTLVSYDEFSTKKWVNRGEVVQDYYVKVPNGANRIGIYGGTIDKFVRLISVKLVSLTVLNRLGQDANRIYTSLLQVENNPNDQLSHRIQEIEKELEDSDVYLYSDVEDGYYYNMSSLVVGTSIFNGERHSFSSPGTWGILPPITVRKGGSIIIYTKGGTNGRAYCITDKNGLVLALAPENADYRTTPFTYTANQDVIVYVDCYTLTPSSTSQFKVITNIEKLEDVDRVLENHEERIETLESQTVLSYAPKIYNPNINISNVNTLKVLDIGNSFTFDALSYIGEFINATNIDVNNMSLYTMTRSGGSYKTFIDSWNNVDSYDSTQGCCYTVAKTIGANQTINGSTLLERMHYAIKNVKWDIILIHQVSQYSDDFEDWEGYTDSGHLKEFIRILKTYQPQAMIGYLWGHCSYNMSIGGETSKLWEKTRDGIKWMQASYGINFVIPVATAIENLRISSLNVSPVAYGFSRDGHHLAYGLARYVASATYFQTLIGARYGISVLGNTATHTVTSSELSDAAYPDDCIDVSNSNKELAQICAVLADADMYSIVVPDGIDIDG